MNDVLKEKVLRLGYLYAILGTYKNSTRYQIKYGYKKKVLYCHPDKNPSESAKYYFCRLNEAYTLLKDPQLKKYYDRYLETQVITQQKLQAMTLERRKFAYDLNRREKYARDVQQKADENQQRKKKFQYYQLKEYEYREKARNKLREEMEPSTFYKKINQVKVTWADSLSFNDKLLRLAFQKWGSIKYVSLNPCYAILEFVSIEAAYRLVRYFIHPKIQVSFLIGSAKRAYMLKSLKRNKYEKIDMSLSSDNLRRLADLINRNSSTYVSVETGRGSKAHYEDILKKYGFI